MAFTYSLEALMRCYETELMPLKEELAKLNIALQQLETQRQTLEQEMSSVQNHIAQSWQQPELRRLGVVFLQEQKKSHKQMVAAQQEKEQSIQDVQNSITDVRTKIRQLEKYKERLREDYLQQQQKQQLHESDDMWLRFTRHREQEYEH